jgi:2-methylisocitrate lyase-like PEP mutase family enzyme
METRTARLRALLAGAATAKAPLVAPGAVDALTARIIEEAGFPVAYVTGAGIANAMLGAPDVGLVTLTEMAERIRHVADAVTTPIIADADTGYGGVGNVRRTVRAYEDAGAAGLHLEDQEMPKRCGHFEGKTIAPQREMLVRLQAAIDARRDPDFLIIARTDARTIEGLDAALARARAYLALGVDGIFVEAPQDVAELRRVGSELAGTLLVANMVEGGKTPLLPAAELGAMGYGLVLYANAPLRLAAHAVQAGLRVLRETGTTATILDRMLSWPERQRLVRLAEHDEYEKSLKQRIDGAP